MKKYDFETSLDRRNTSSTKWNIKKDEISLSLADMDFKVASEIEEDLKKVISFPIYGYVDISEEWYSAYQKYFLDEYDLKIEKEEMMFSLGVVPSISSSVRKFTDVGDNIVVLSPVYNIFYNSIVNNFRNVIEVPLLRKEDEFFIDFPSLEEAFKDEKTKMIIFCNPANPVGKIWSKEEMKKLGELAKKYDVLVLSDEIHGFITRTGKKYIPFFSISEINRDISLTCLSVTKAFNLACIHTSCIFAFNKDIYKKINRQINTDEVAEPNILSCTAAVSALTKGKDWLYQMREKVFKNKDYVTSYINSNIKPLHCINGDATYLLFIDYSKIRRDGKDFVKFIRDKTGLVLSDGKIFGKGGENYFRMNVACPFSTVEDALNRLKRGVDLYLTI